MCSGFYEKRICPGTSICRERRSDTETIGRGVINGCAVGISTVNKHLFARFAARGNAERVSACTGASEFRSNLPGTPTDDVAYGVAWAPNGDAIVARVSAGVVDASGYNVSAGALRLTAFDSTLAQVRNKILSPTGGAGTYAAPRAVGTDAAGNVFVAGEFQGNLTVPSGTLTSAGIDVIVAKLDPGFNILWAKRFGDNAFQPFRDGN